MARPTARLVARLVARPAGRAFPLASFVRLGAPHRTVAAVLTGAAVAVARGGATPGGAGVFLTVVALTTVALVALRARDLLQGAASAAVRGVVTGIAGGAAGVALVVLIIAASWPAVAILVLLFLVEWAFFLPPLSLARTVPVEAGLAAAEGVVLPALGYAAVLGRWAAPWPLLAATLCVSIAAVSAAFVQEQTADSLAPGRTLRSFAPPTAVAVLSLAGLTAAIAMVLAGAGPGLGPELALLASAVAVMAAFFGWLSLFDPRPQSRLRRLEALVTLSVLSWYGGLVLVLLVA